MNLFQILDPTTPNGCGDLEAIIRFVKLGVLPIIQIGVPILLIVMGSIDLGRAVLSSDDKEIKAATSKLIKRAIAAIAVFFVATIVTLLMGLFAKSGADSSEGVEGTTDWKTCWTSIN